MLSLSVEKKDGGEAERPPHIPLDRKCILNNPGLESVSPKYKRKMIPRSLACPSRSYYLRFAVLSLRGKRNPVAPFDSGLGDSDEAKDRRPLLLLFLLNSSKQPPVPKGSGAHR